MRLHGFILVLLLILPGCLGESTDETVSGIDSEISIEVWYTFAAETIEEEVFLETVESIIEETGVDVKATRVSYGDADQLGDIFT